MSKILGSLDRDVAKKIAEKYDPAKEAEVHRWIGNVLGRSLPDPKLDKALHDGTILCHLLNAIFPGTVSKIGTKNMPFSHRENISNYLESCKRLGMPLVDLFDTQDLYDSKNMVSVINHLYSLSVFSKTSSKFKGPYIGAAKGGSVRAKVSPNVSSSVTPSSTPAMRPMKMGNVGSRQSTKQYPASKNEDQVLGELDRDLAEKLAAKHDPEKEAAVRSWIETVLGDSFGSQSLEDALHSGVKVCELFNKLFPGSIQSINKKTMAFFQRENISQYLEACKKRGLPLVDLFDTQDLYDGKNMPSVVNHFYSLSSFARKNSTAYKGPHIGAKLADKNERDFTEEQMNRGKFIPRALY